MLTSVKRSLSLILIFLFPIVVNAAVPEDLKIDEAMKLEISVDDQLYPSKNIIIKLKIDTLIDSSRVGIDWYYDDTVIRRLGDETDIITISQGNETIIYKEFEPKSNYALKKNYDINIAVRVVAASYDKNYVNTDEIDFTINKDFEITPLLNSYITHRDVYNLLMSMLYFILLMLFIVLIVLGIKRFKIYLETD